MGKRKARNSPPGGKAQPKIPKLFQTSRASSGCVTDDIDNLIEEVEALLTKKDKDPQKCLKNGSLTTFLKPCEKGKIPTSDATTRPLPFQAGSLTQNKGGPYGALSSVEETSARSVIVHEIPCSNRFSVLESLGHNEDLGFSNEQATSQHAIFPSQKDLLTLVVELKEEVKDLKISLAEVLSLLRSKSTAMVNYNSNNPETITKTRPHKVPVSRKTKEKSPLRALSAHDQASTVLSFGHNSFFGIENPYVSTSAHRIHARVANSAQNAHQSRDCGHSIYMCRVPSLATNIKEDTTSLKNKVIHWIGHTRQCSSVIHSDIIFAQRYPTSEGQLDIIKLTLSTPDLVRGHLSLEMRNPLQNGLKIYFKSCWPEDDHAPISNLLAPKRILDQSNNQESAPENVLPIPKSPAQLLLAAETK
ncbi:hypothetical protein NDU88_007992 [Pleurodeles waltl]|uniref:Uncharacterized protein n=1 Tax=Pleurodeles waltl TaxID=8319 RepID=A0AAV7NY25_PLEWA|nr:hypothetical protein NDU88_007992 [Pleurodeles waltl]